MDQHKRRLLYRVEESTSVCGIGIHELMICHNNCVIYFLHLPPTLALFPDFLHPACKVWQVLNLSRPSLKHHCMWSVNTGVQVLVRVQAYAHWYVHTKLICSHQTILNRTQIDGTCEWAWVWVSVSGGKSLHAHLPACTINEPHLL